MLIVTWSTAVRIKAFRIAAHATHRLVEETAGG